MLIRAFKGLLAAGLIGFGACLPAAASTWTWHEFTLTFNPAPVDFYVDLEITLVPCFTGEPCLRHWTSSNFGALAVGAERELPLGVRPPVFDLGDELTGMHQVALSSSFSDQNPQFADELFVELVHSFNFLGTTSQGRLNFDAVAGTPYYLFVHGRLRQGESYSLTVFRVPEPESTLLVGTGGVLMWLARRRQKLLGTIRLAS